MYSYKFSQIEPIEFYENALNTQALGDKKCQKLASS